MLPPDFFGKPSPLSFLKDPLGRSPDFLRNEGDESLSESLLEYDLPFPEDCDLEDDDLRLPREPDELSLGIGIGLGVF